MATMETYRHPPESPYSYPPHPQQSHHRHPQPSHPHSHPHHHHHQRHPSSDLSSHHLPYLRPPTYNGAQDDAWPRFREEASKRGQIENTPPSPMESQLPHPKAQVHYHHYHDHQQQSNQRGSPRDFGRVDATPSSPLQSRPSHHISQPHSRRRDEMSSPPLPLPHQYAHAPLEHRVLRPTHAERPQHSQHSPTQQQQRSKGQLSEQRGSEQHYSRQSFVHQQEQRAPMQSPPPPPPAPHLAPRPPLQPQTVPQPQPQPQQLEQQQHEQQEKQQEQQRQKQRTHEQLELELLEHEKEQKERWQQRKKIQGAQAASKQRALDEKLRRQEEYLQRDLQRQKQLHQAKTKQLKEEERLRKAAMKLDQGQQQRMHDSSGRPLDSELPSSATAPTALASYPSQPLQSRPSSAPTASSPHHPHYQHYPGAESSLKRPRETEGPRAFSTYQQPPHHPQGQYRPPSPPRENQPWPRSASPLSRKGSTVSLSKLSLEEEGGFRPRHQSTASWSEPSSSGARGTRMVMEDQHAGYRHSQSYPPAPEQPHPPRPAQNPHHLSFHHQAQPSPKPRSLQRPQPHSPMDITSPPAPSHMQQDVKRIRVEERTREHWEAAATAPSTPVVAARPEMKRPLSYEYYGSSSLQRSPSQGSRRAIRQQSATVTQSSSFPAHAPALPVFTSRPHSPVGLPPVYPVPARLLAQPSHPRHYPSPQTPDSSRLSYPSGNSSSCNNYSLQPRSQPKEHWNATQPITARDRMPQPPPGMVAHGQGQGRDRDDRERWEHENRALELRPPSKEPAVVDVRGGGGGGGVGSQQRPTTFLSGSSSEPGFHPSHQPQQQHYHPSPRHEQHPQQQQQYHPGHPSPYPQHHGHF